MPASSCGRWRRLSARSAKARASAGDISVGAVLGKYPNLKLSLAETLSGATLMHLMASEVDLALVCNPPSDKDLIAEPVLEQQRFCVGTIKLIGMSRAPITFEEVTRLPLITLLHGLSSRALLDDPALLKRLEANAIFHLNSICGMIGALLAGLGCAVATKLFVKEQLQPGTLTARGDRAKTDANALSLPAAQPSDDLCHGANAPPDADPGRRAGRAGRLAGDTPDLSYRFSRTQRSICSSGFLARDRQHDAAATTRLRRSAPGAGDPGRIQGGQHDDGQP